MYSQIESTLSQGAPSHFVSSEELLPMSPFELPTTSRTFVDHYSNRSFSDAVRPAPEQPPPLNPVASWFHDRFSKPADARPKTPPSQKNGVFENFVRSTFPGASVACENTADLTTGLLGLLPALEQMISDSQRCMNGFTNASAAVTSLTSSVQGIVDSVPVLQGINSSVVDAVLLIYDIIVAWWSRVYASIPTLIYRLLNLFGVALPMIEKFVSLCTTCFRSSELTQDESRAVPESSALSILSLLTTGVGLICTRDVPSHMQVRSITDALRLKGFIMNEVKDATGIMLWFCQTLPDQVKMWFSRIMPIEWWMKIFSPNGAYYGWIDRIEAICTTAKKQLASHDRATQREVEELYEGGVELSKLATDNGTKNSAVFNLLKRYLDKIQEMHEIVDLASNKTGHRMTPFCFYLAGPPGTGKSFLSTALCAVLTDSDPGDKNLIYPRDPWITHWDGYSNQKATLFEDFAMLRGGNVSPGEYGEFTYCVSNVEYQLPMANLRDKGAYFGSQIVAVSSNIAYPRPNEMNTVEALWRRRHVLVNVTALPQYCFPGTTTVDPRLVPADNSHWRFQLLNPTTDRNNMIGNQMMFTDFVEYLQNAHDRHVEGERISRDASLRLARNMVAHRRQVMAERVEVFQDAREEIAVAQTKDTIILSNLFSVPDTASTGLCAAGAVLAGGTVYRLSEDLVEALVRIVEPVPNWVKFGLSLLPYIALAATTFATYLLLKKFTSKDAVVSSQISLPVERKEEYGSYAIPARMEKSVRAEGAYNQNPSGRISRARVIRQARNVKSIPSAIARAEATDDNAVAVMNSNVVPNLARLEVNGLECSCIYVRGQVILAPRHAFADPEGELVKDGSNVAVSTVTEIFRDYFQADRLVEIGTDVVLYKLMITSRCFRDITKHFMSDDDIDMHRRFKGAITVLDNGYVPTVHYINVQGNSKPFAYQPGPHRSVLGPGAMRIEEFECWSYNAEVARGDCGSPILAFDPRMPRKLVGMHIASGSTAYGVVVTGEMISEGLRALGDCAPPGIPRPVAELARAECSEIDPCGNFHYQGCLSHPIGSSSRTSIGKSILFDKVFPHTQEPAVLHKNDPRLKIDVDPLVQGIEKYGRVAIPMNPCILEEIKEYMISLFSSLESSIGRDVVSEYEAVNGCNSAYALPLVMNTSPGFPYNQRVDKKKGKAWLFNVNGFHTDGSPLYEVEDEELRFKIDFRWRQMLEGNRVPSLWIDTLKDETRPIEKIENGKTRVFTIPPVDYTITTRRLFLKFCAAFYENRNKFFSAVGISPEPDACNEWTALYHRLSAVSPVGFAGDYSSWDGTLAPQAMEMMCDVVNAWYDDDEKYQRARRVAINEVIHTCQIASNLVYVTNQGNPSGMPFTSILNTFVGAVYLRYAWLILAPPLYRSLVLFDNHVSDAIYGDDAIVAVSEVALDFYNPHVVSKEFAKFGITFTSTTKDGESTIQKIEDMTFLKRGFKRGGGLEWMPTMSVDTCREMVNWIRRSDDPLEMICNNVNESLRFMFFHGKKAFDEHRRSILNELPTELHRRILTYAYFYDWVYNVVERAQPQANNVIETTNTMGIISLSQRATTEDAATPGQNVLINRLTTAAAIESEWKLSDMTERRVLENVYSWSSADSPGTSYVRLQLPTDALVAYLQTAAFERFYMWNGHVRAHIQVNGTRFHAGRLIAFFVPGTHLDITANWHELNLHLPAKTAVANVQIDASANNVGVLDMNYYNIASYITPNNVSAATEPQFIGAFVVQVLSQLQAAGSTAPAISFSVWFEFPEPQQFKVPIFTAGATLQAYNRQHYEQARRRAEKLVATHDYDEYLRDLRGLEIAEAQGNTPSTGSTINNYGTMNDTALSQKTVGDEIGCGNTVSVPTMDKPGYTLSGVGVYRTPFQNICNTQGTDIVNRLTLDPSSLNMCSIEHFSTSKDEMLISHLTQTPNMFDRFMWNATDAAGHILYSCPVGPLCSTMFTTPTHPSAGQEYAIPMLDYVSNFYRFWRGSIIFRFDVVASQMHTGRLFIAPHYGVYSALSDGIRDATSQFGVVVDLANESKTFTLEIPYKSITPWLQINNGDFNSSYDGTFRNMYLGLMSVRVLNTLVAPDNAPPNVEILVSVCGGTDFQLYYPNPVNTCFFPLSVGGAPVEIAEAQSASTASTETADDAAPVPTMHDDDASNNTAVVIAKEPVKLPRDRHFGERHDHLGQLLKRYVPADPYLGYNGYNGCGLGYVDPATSATDSDWGFTLLSSNANAEPTATWLAWLRIDPRPVHGQQVGAGTPAIPSGTHMITNMWSPMGYFGHLFRLWRGSTRIKVLWGQSTDATGAVLNISHRALVYTPNIKWNTSQRMSPYNNNNTAWTMMNYFLPNVFSTFASVVTVPGLYTSLSGGGLAVNVCPQGIEYNEVEIPFTTIYNSLLTPCHIPTSWEDPRLSTQGTCYAMFTFSTVGTTDNIAAMKASGINVMMNVYQAAGDEMRFGALLGPPRMFAAPMCSSVAPSGPTSIWPAGWQFVSSEREVNPYVPKAKMRFSMKGIKKDDIEIAEAQAGVPRYRRSNSNEIELAKGMLKKLEEYVCGGAKNARSILNELKTDYDVVHVNYDISPIVVGTSIRFKSICDVELFPDWSTLTGIANEGTKKGAQEQSAAFAIGNCIVALTTFIGKGVIKDSSDDESSEEMELNPPPQLSTAVTPKVEPQEPVVEQNPQACRALSELDMFVISLRVEMTMTDTVVHHSREKLCEFCRMRGWVVRIRSVPKIKPAFTIVASIHEAGDDAPIYTTTVEGYNHAASVAIATHNLLSAIVVDHDLSDTGVSDNIVKDGVSFSRRH